MTRESDALISHCPQCGSQALTWPSPKHFSCADCGFVLYLNCAAAVAVIMECQGKILFGVRKHEPQLGMLDLPGGFVDQGESAEEAVRREVQEELGIAIHDMRYLFSFPNKYRYRGIEYDTLDLIFLARWDEPPAVKAADDLADALWVSHDAVEYDKIGFGSLRRAVRRYLEIEYPGLEGGCP
ncbi:NUDIX domain-containing protein [Trichlorobacter lovleyi]|uniref:NUDIX hydrolase n=1 Tax=Trichlorobacter lovleyi TaxID=313985 RepID=UPI00223F2D50|nr:NUDIX domain-containing protein [Trichlorobacter lovleyi]QOX79641.1 NUDIX domain-containing protein [Trichlorobacter lovleyi]